MEFNLDIIFMQLELEKDLRGYYRGQMKIMVLRNNLTQSLVFGNNPMNFLLFWFVIFRHYTEKHEVVFSLFSIVVFS